MCGFVMTGTEHFGYAGDCAFSEVRYMEIGENTGFFRLQCDVITENRENLWYH